MTFSADLAQLWAAEALSKEDAFPRLHALTSQPFQFQPEFGLRTLPTEPGVLLIRGPRQYGKSTWMEVQLRQTIEEFGPGSALFLDGDHLEDDQDLSHWVTQAAASFRKDAPVRRLFIDEITSVDQWELGLKRPLDRGDLAKVLVVTTGSRATDLRRGFERLPGRKGKLERTSYWFGPVSYKEFLRVAGESAGPDPWIGYLLSGGAPVACSEILEHARIPTWRLETVRDWILGECARSGRQRRSLLAVMDQIHRHGASPLGQTKLAKEAGLANNTIAAGYIELLADLMVLGISGAVDLERRVELPRKAAKYPFINLLAALAWAQDSPTTPQGFRALHPARQGVWMEWLVAQELHRRQAIAGVDEPERLPFWQGADHEIDFALPGELVEVKRGPTAPLEFAWFARTHPKRRLTVISSSQWETDYVRSITLEQFLLEG